MADRGSRWGVVIVARFLDEQHLERHRDIEYIAKVISNTQGREMTENGRNYVFGGTINEVEFYEVTSEAIAKKLAHKFNCLWDSRIRQRLSILAKTIK